ncbi:MAG: hypothetical protein KC621_23205 [Myxococcales bacterium]|nr:hypothetical protein [Myxococcales bacterium]MCB9648417.1 hypothetical protein [Deltaproteobacteria bacterium]
MKKLDEAVLVDPIRSVNFFNGRLLTAEDLREEREAARAHRRALGRGVGAGVVEGLWVTSVSGGSGPAVRVEAGRAIDGDGTDLTLPQPVTLSLTEREKQLVAIAPDFDVCLPPQGALLEGVGVYLLVMSPQATLSVDRAPKSGLGTDGRAFGCEARWVLETVVFRMEYVQLDAALFPELTGALATELAALDAANDEASRSLRRNYIAHLFFGTLARRRAGIDPFATGSAGSAYAAYGPVDALRGSGVLRPCDVPLALISWRGATLDFVDVWPVRRRPIPPARSATLPALGDDRARREGEAVHLQFFEQMQQVLTTASQPSMVRATDYFRFLPPCGLLRVQQPGRRGVAVDVFFQGFPRREPPMVDAALLDQLVARSFRYEPIDVREQELVWLYRPWQNVWERDHGASIQDVVVFTSPHVPEQGLARFDVARWDYSNFASGRGCE